MTFKSFYLVRIFFFSLALLFLFTFLEWHGSSIPLWNDTFSVPSNYATGLVWQKPLLIRTDEYRVVTPWKISQALAGFATHNSNIGGAQTALLISCSRHWISIFKPSCWGYFLGSPAQGFAWEWNLACFLFFWSFAALVWTLTRNALTALLSSLWLYTSSYSIWWGGLPQVFGFCLCLICFYYLLTLKNKKWGPLLALGIGYGAINSALTLYIPWLVNLIYLGFFLGAAIFVNHIKNEAPKKQALIYSVLFLVAAITLIFFVLWNFKTDVTQVFEIMLHTEYPGKRLSSSGTLPLAQIFSGVFDVYYSLQRFPASLANVCEASNFILLFPFVFIAWLIEKIRYRTWGKQDHLLTSLFCFCFLSLLVMTWGLNPTIEKILFLDRLPNQRALLALGLANILILALYLQNQNETAQIPNRDFLTLAYFTCCILFLVYVLKQLPTLDIFFTGFKSTLVFLVVLILIAAIYFRWQKIVYALILLQTLPNWRMHPLSVGLKPFTQKALYQTVQKIHLQHPNAQWAAFTSAQYANFLKTTGVKVLNGSFFAPNLELLKKLDPQGLQLPIYNRYGHMNMIATTAPKPYFVLNAADEFTLMINPCDPALKSLNLTYFVFKKHHAQKWDCLKFLESADGFEIWTRH